MSVEKLYAACKPRCDDIFVLEKYLRLRFALETRDPWLNRPDGVHAAALKQTELIRIGSWDHHHIATHLRDLEPLRLQPRSTGNILRVAELRCGNFFSAKIRRRLDRTIRFDDECCASVRCTREDSDFFAVGFKVGIERWPLSDVSQVERAGKDRLHRRRSRIRSEPLDLGIGAEPLFKPAFALTRQGVSNHTLCMRDVWEMPETNHRFFFCAGGLHEKRNRPDNRYQCFCLHSFVFNRRMPS